jgi:hypothetical protein
MRHVTLQKNAHQVAHLVEEQDLWVAHQRPRNGNPLLLPACIRNKLGVHEHAAPGLAHHNTKQVKFFMRARFYLLLRSKALHAWAILVPDIIRRPSYLTAGRRPRQCASRSRPAATL